jgi:hypothetical protein
MQTYELTLDDSPKAQLLLELLKGMDVVKELKRKSFNDFTREGKPLAKDELLEMIAAVEEDVANGNTFTTEQVRKIIVK